MKIEIFMLLDVSRKDDVPFEVEVHSCRNNLSKLGLVRTSITEVPVLTFHFEYTI